MRRAIQITVVTALILFGPVGVFDAVCWWSMGCFAGFEQCQVELSR